MLIGWSGAALSTRIAATALFALGLLYFVKGSYYMFTSAGDFKLRWTEQHYVFRGTDPSAAWERQNAVMNGLQVRARVENATVEPDLGPIEEVPYPPWAYFTGALFTWPSSFQTARVLFAAVNLVAFAWLLAWAIRLGSAGSGLAGWALALSVFATASICTTFGLGQYGVLVLAALAGTALFAERGNWLLAGVLFAVALTKVTLAAPFAVALVFSKYIKTVATACIYIACASGAVALNVHSDPVTMMRGMFSAAEHVVNQGYSLINPLMLLGMNARLAMIIAAVGTIGIGSAVMWLIRREPLLTQFAIAGVVSRLWTYHVHYDNLIMLFLLMALGTLPKQSKSVRITFAVAGLALWAPARACDFAAFRVFQLVAWIACSAILVVCARDFRKRPSRPSAPIAPITATAARGA
jgi:hypothetical protein